MFDATQVRVSNDPESRIIGEVPVDEVLEVFERITVRGVQMMRYRRVHDQECEWGWVPLSHPAAPSSDGGGEGAESEPRLRKLAPDERLVEWSAAETVDPAGPTHMWCAQRSPRSADTTRPAQLTKETPRSDRFFLGRRLFDAERECDFSVDGSLRCVCRQERQVRSVNLREAVIESPWLQSTRECQRFWHPPRLNIPLGRCARST
jgi:hypothetical protein